MKSQPIDQWLAEREQDDDRDNERYVSYRYSDLWPEWQERAHCAGVGLEYYFGVEGQLQMSMSIKAISRAAKLCDVCPVFTECLRWALENREEYGIWAGTSGRLRRNIFSLLDHDMTTVDDVIEVILNGGKKQYRSTPLPAGEAHLPEDQATDDECGSGSGGHDRSGGVPPALGREA